MILDVMLKEISKLVEILSFEASCLRVRRLFFSTTVGFLCKMSYNRYHFSAGSNKKRLEVVKQIL